MLVYPQLSTGALSQFPIRKRRWSRTICNTAADGSVVKLADPGAETTEWRLEYTGLSDGEAAALAHFFEQAEGTLGEFVFLDPTGNLLAWSGDLTKPVWTSGPFLARTGGSADPHGGLCGWHVRNNGAGAQSVSQTLSAPGDYRYCLSVYARAEAPVSVKLVVGPNSRDYEIGSDWSRIAFAASGGIGGESVAFAVEVPGGGEIDLFGFQAEAQGSPSCYRASTTGGVHANTRLRYDILPLLTTGVNCHSATVNLIHASHL